MCVFQGADFPHAGKASVFKEGLIDERGPVLIPSNHGIEQTWGCVRMCLCVRETNPAE